MNLPPNKIVYRWLKVIRSAVMREQNPDWFSTDSLEPLHIESLNRLMRQHLALDCQIKRERVVELADHPSYHVLVAFDGRQGEPLESSPIVAHARLFQKINLLESESFVEDVVVDSGFVDHGILRELVLRLEDCSATLGCRRMYLPDHIRPDGFPEEAPTKEHPIHGQVSRQRVRQGMDLDAPESILERGDST